MSDWDFLYEMHEQGYSPEEIADAAGSGAAPWEWDYLDTEWLKSQLAEVPEADAHALKPKERFESRHGYPNSIPKQKKILLDLIDCAARHFENTGRYLQIWGELGEVYAEAELGLCRHMTHTAGSDGTIAGRLVEVKTISPEKFSDRVHVKSKGNFEQLLIVGIDQNFRFRTKLLNRNELNGVTGKHLKGRLKEDGDNT